MKTVTECLQGKYVLRHLFAEQSMLMPAHTAMPYSHAFYMKICFFPFLNAAIEIFATILLFQRVIISFLNITINDNIA